MRTAAAAAAVTVGAAGGCLAVARVEGAMVTAQGAGEGGREGWRGGGERGRAVCKRRTCGDEWRRTVAAVPVGVS